MSAPLNFLVFAPRFDQTSGGAIALHRLCDLLRQSGERAYLWPMGRPSPLRWRGLSFTARSAYYKGLALKNGAFHRHPGFDTPVADSSLLEHGVAIYPETVDGDPLGTGRCVRWLLHEPGFHTGRVNYSSKDLLFYFQDEFAMSELARSYNPIARLQTLWVRDDIYHDDGSEERHGDCYMVRKGQVHHPSHSPSALCLDGMSPARIAREFQTRRRFYSYDPYTMYSAYAAACGCDSIIVPPPGMTRDQWYADDAKRQGVAFGEEDLPRARATRAGALAFMKAEEKAAQASVARFATYCHDHYIGSFGGAASPRSAITPRLS